MKAQIHMCFSYIRAVYLAEGGTKASAGEQPPQTRGGTRVRRLHTWDRSRSATVDHLDQPDHLDNLDPTFSVVRCCARAASYRCHPANTSAAARGNGVHEGPIFYRLETYHDLSIYCRSSVDSTLFVMGCCARAVSYRSHPANMRAAAASYIDMDISNPPNMIYR